MKGQKILFKLIVLYESDNGKLKDIVIASKNNSRIKMLLDEYKNGTTAG